jgi:SRSO17 transposase
MPLSAFTESVFEFRRFVRRYQEVFHWQAQRRHFEAYLRGLIGPLERKSIEPIALDQHVNWRSLQDFIGCSPWDAEALLREHRRHVRETLGSARGILILDPTSFPKRGDKSVGVARQWCGQLGKEENCVVEGNLAYASEKGHTFLDRRLYLPKEWADNLSRRHAAGVPDDVVFRTSGELAYEMISQARRDGLPHAWITGDEEFGKLPWLQDWLHEDGERYILEIPCSTQVGVTLPKRRIRGPKAFLEHLRVRGPGRPQLVRVDVLARRLSTRAWAVYEVRDGSKGPIRVRAALLRVRSHRRQKEDRRDGWLLITQTLDQQRQTKYFHSDAAPDIRIEELLQAGFARWPVEQCHGQGKNETGLGDYETRSWLGWHHHTALAFLAHHWLTLERNRMGKKIPGDDRRGGTASLLRGLANRMRAASEIGSANAAPASPEPDRTPIALEDGLGRTSRSGTAQARRIGSRKIGHRSNAYVKTVEYQ